MNRITTFSILVISCLLFLALLRRYFNKIKYLRYFEIAVFFIYVCGFLYFTFLSREAEKEALLVLQPLRIYRMAFSFDDGFVHVIKQIFTEGPSVGFSSIHIESKRALEGLVLNILLFIPLGYMLPCVFEKLQKALWRVILIGFFCSLLTETVQLVTHLGWFDLDDLLNNSMGCVVGVIFYGSFLKERRGTD